MAQTTLPDPAPARVGIFFDPARGVTGGPAQGVDVEPGAVTMRDGLVRLGIPPDRIVIESLSTNTREEAVFVARRT